MVFKKIEPRPKPSIGLVALWHERLDPLPDKTQVAVIAPEPVVQLPAAGLSDESHAHGFRHNES